MNKDSSPGPEAEFDARTRPGAGRQSLALPRMRRIKSVATSARNPHDQGNRDAQRAPGLAPGPRLRTAGSPPAR
ncbi:hypothetical protein RA210_U80039 [Rubrivivax sp. A210]|nr:hypothetical protein RA210_U80039 [Rubrivivax sp. A210]